MPEYPLIESFRWYVPDLAVKSDPAWGNKVKVRGVAIPGGVVSRNNRRYVKREIELAARSLIGKPITVNHDNTKIIGHIEDAEFEENGLEYVGWITKQPYVDKMRDRASVQAGEMDAESYFMKWNVQPINGVSIDAGYRYNRCIHCGERFTDLQVWNTHMWEKHQVKSDLREEPHGIVMKALSAVEPPETPGVSAATIELAETVGGGLSQLLETVTRDKQTLEKLNKANIALHTEKHIAPLREQEEECPEGHHKDPETGKCVLDTATTEQTEGEPAPAVKSVPEPEGEVKVSDDVPPEAATQPPCAAGSHFDDELGMCVPDAEVAPPATDIAPPVMEKLELGEPFSDYDSFADCVSKNSDKKDPEAYCGQIQHKTEGETTESKYAFEVYKLDQQKKMEQLLKRVKPLHYAIREYAKDLSKLKAATASHSKDITKLAKQAEQSHNVAVESIKLLTGNLTSLRSSLVKQNNFWRDSLVSITKQVSSTEAYGDRITKLQEALDEQKTAYETILGGMDTKYKEFKLDMTKKLEEAQATITKQTEEKEEQTAKETMKKDTRLDNMEAKIEKLSKFKGKVEETKKQAGFKGDPLKKEKN
jgi:hypothetical protein